MFMYGLCKQNCPSVMEEVIAASTAERVEKTKSNFNTSSDDSQHEGRPIVGDWTHDGVLTGLVFFKDSLYTF